EEGQDEARDTQALARECARLGCGMSLSGGRIALGGVRLRRLRLLILGHSSPSITGRGSETVSESVRYCHSPYWCRGNPPRYARTRLSAKVPVYSWMAPNFSSKS